MHRLNRRAFLASAGALSVFPFPSAQAVQTVCVSNGVPFTPSRLTVDCASKRNFANYRKNSTYQGLVGVVSMTYVKARYGEYPAGNLFLFPWLNAKGIALGVAKDWQAVMPTNLAQMVSAGPIRGWTMALDEYFSYYVLQAPRQSFIGFRVDAPFPERNSPTRPWRTNVDRLADGAPIGIEWTSHNMNGPWFGGSNWIPPTDDCRGNTWRNLIVEGLNQASIARC